jgi:hypothetical protein
MKSLFPFISLLIFFQPSSILAQKAIVKDSVVYRFIYRDTMIYRYDTVRIKHYVHSDTLWTTPVVAASPKRKGVIDRNNWGIGPSIGAYYSPFNGFDVNVGFGIQYYLFAVPSFRNPHLGHKRNRN